MKLEVAQVLNSVATVPDSCPGCKVDFSSRHALALKQVDEYTGPGVLANGHWLVGVKSQIKYPRITEASCMDCGLKIYPPEGGQK